MTISVGNAQSAASGTTAVSSLTLPNYTLSAGSNKILLIATLMKRAGSTVAPGALTTTFGGVAATPFLTVNGTGSPYERIVLSYLLAGNSTSTGDIVSSVSSSTPTMIILAWTLIDAAQAAPEASASSTTTNGPTGITTGYDNEYLVGIAMGGSPLGALDSSETAGPTAAVGTSGNSNYFAAAMSGKLGGTAGSQTMAGWAASASKPLHAVLAFRPAAQAFAQSITATAAGSASVLRSNGRSLLAAGTSAASLARRMAKTLLGAGLGEIGRAHV